MVTNKNQKEEQVLTQKDNTIILKMCKTLITLYMLYMLQLSMKSMTVTPIMAIVMIFCLAKVLLLNREFTVMNTVQKYLLIASILVLIPYMIIHALNTVNNLTTISQMENMNYGIKILYFLKDVRLILPTLYTRFEKTYSSVLLFSPKKLNYDIQLS